MSDLYFHGRKGEDITADYLRRKGFIIYKRNYHSRFGEIDIIAEKGDLLLFVEVKTRSENAMVSGAEAVDYNKQSRIRMTASDFLRKTHSEYRCRFDVSEVTVMVGEKGFKYRLKYVTDAFI